ncbi:hypothetical protein FSP39_011794 [Pinctada imbricata]|uniref:Uncharacterized protein n=1 Tax=Pinctada imbricata TaxID=66713 RepID=A0AA89BPD5_PINIB|nr:hypothetical protein FSP39_011794 [Pinctada imbricata]
MHQKRNKEILSFATDGQWIQLMSRDSDKNPQTILQFQDFWNTTKSLSKAELVKKISEVNKTDSNSHLSDKLIKRNSKGSLEVSTKGSVLFDITTPVGLAQWSKKALVEIHDTS